jgi:hypothetical protein
MVMSWAAPARRSAVRRQDQLRGAGTGAACGRDGALLAGTSLWVMVAPGPGSDVNHIADQASRLTRPHFRPSQTAGKIQRRPSSGW